MVAALSLENMVALVFAFPPGTTAGDDLLDVVTVDRHGGSPVADPQVRLPGVAVADGPALPDSPGHGPGLGLWPAAGKLLNQSSVLWLPGLAVRMKFPPNS